MGRWDLQGAIENKDSLQVPVADNRTLDTAWTDNRAGPRNKPARRVGASEESREGELSVRGGGAKTKSRDRFDGHDDAQGPMRR